MKNQLIVFVICFFALIVSSSASVLILDKETFVCSDGKPYDVLRHYIGGWGPGNWKLVGICSAGTLTQKSYNGRVLTPRNSHADIANCQDQDNDSVRFCYYEFKRINGSKGVSLTPIVHGGSQSTEIESYENVPLGYPNQPYNNAIK